MLITSGRVNTPEVRTLAGNLRSLSTASLSLPLYPWMDVAPNGRAFYSGPDQTLRALDTVRHRHVAGAGAARHDQPRLRRSRALRHREDARRRRRAFDEGRTGRRLQRGHAAGLDDRADGLRAPAAQPDRARRRLGPRNGRQLLRRPARRPQRRRLSGRAVEPRHRAMADPGRDADHAPVPLDRAPAARRARPLRRRRDLRHVRPGRLSRQERRDLLAALPLPGRRHARSAPVDRRRTGVHELRRADRRSQPQSGVDPQGCPRPARRRHALGQHGAALYPAVLHRRRDEPHRRPLRPTPTSRRRGSTCSSSSTPTACLPSPAWSASRAIRRRPSR